MKYNIISYNTITISTVAETQKNESYKATWLRKVEISKSKCFLKVNKQSREWLVGTHTHTHPFNGPLSGTTWVSRYQRGKTNLDFTEARHSEWQWYQLGHMQLCTSLQTDNHASTPPLSFFTGQMPFLPPNQQRQGTEDKKNRFTHTKRSAAWEHIPSAKLRAS